MRSACLYGKLLEPRNSQTARKASNSLASLHVLVVDEAPGGRLDRLGPVTVHGGEQLVAVTEDDRAALSIREVANNLNAEGLAVVVVLDLNPLAARLVQVLLLKNRRGADHDGDSLGVRGKVASVGDIGPPERSRLDSVGRSSARGLGSVAGRRGSVRGSSLLGRGRSGLGLLNLTRVGLLGSGLGGGGGLLLLLLLGGTLSGKVPADGEDTVTHVAVVQRREETLRHVERAVATAGAEVSNGGSLRVAVLLVGDGHLLTAVRASLARRATPLRSVEGNNKVGARVGPATGTCSSEA